MSVARDIKIISQMLIGSRTNCDDHGERMERFYAGQAQDYDAFRERLLPGRQELLNDLAWPDQAMVADLGGGTGANLEFVPNEIHRRIGEWTVVDLSPSLLAMADVRIREKGWNHVSLAQADACTWRPDKALDIVLLSYSLTMIPDWRAVLNHACALLKPGGQIAVVDFTVAHAIPTSGIQPNSFFVRKFWPKWFAWDGVYLNPDHLPTLMTLFQSRSIHQSSTRLPYLPGSRVPYFRYIGQKHRHAPEAMQ